MSILVESKVLDRVARARIVFGHQSVGENILSGVAAIVAPRTLAWTSAKVGRNGDPVDKMDAFAALMRGHADAEIALFKLCYADFDARTDADALFARYESTMTELRRPLPGVRFVHVTTPLTVAATGPKAWLARRLGRTVGGQAESERRHAYNERMRATFAGREPLFDLAALEARGPCRHGSVPGLSPRFTDDGGHLNDRGRRFVAERLLRLLDEMTRGAAEARDCATSRRNVWAHGGGRLTVGDQTRFECGSAGIELKVEKGAELTIGDEVVIEGGTSIEAQRRIVIGDRCRIGRDCKLLDNHLHQVRGDRRVRPPSAPVVLESGVTLEDHVVVLPGAWLERGVQVGTGAVVSRRVPAGTRVEARPVHASRHRETARSDDTRRRHGFRDRPLASVGPRAERALGYLVARHALRGCQVGDRVCVTGRLRVDRRRGRIVVGRGAVFVGGLEPTCLVADDATLYIGEATVINYAVRLAAMGGDIVLGRRCHVGSNVRLLAEPGAPVLVGDDVWIAYGAVIEAGARIGSGSVVAAAAVVRGDVPPCSLAIGYPARSMSLDLAPGGQAAASGAPRASSFWT